MQVRKLIMLPSIAAVFLAAGCAFSKQTGEQPTPETLHVSSVVEVAPTKVSAAPIKAPAATTKIVPTTTVVSTKIITDESGRKILRVQNGDYEAYCRTRLGADGTPKIVEGLGRLEISSHALPVEGYENNPDNTLSPINDLKAETLKTENSETMMNAAREVIKANPMFGYVFAEGLLGLTKRMTVQRTTEGVVDAAAKDPAYAERMRQNDKSLKRLCENGAKLQGLTFEEGASFDQVIQGFQRPQKTLGQTSSAIAKRL